MKKFGFLSTILFFSLIIFSSCKKESISPFGKKWNLIFEYEKGSYNLDTEDAAWSTNPVNGTAMNFANQDTSFFCFIFLDKEQNLYSAHGSISKKYFEVNLEKKLLYLEGDSLSVQKIEVKEVE